MTNTELKIGSNRYINRDEKLTPTELGRAEGMAHDAPKMMKSTDKPVKGNLAAQHCNPKMLVEKHGYDKLAISLVTLLMIGTGLIAHHFW